MLRAMDLGVADNGERTGHKQAAQIAIGPERLIGSIRRECLDHVLFWARHICTGF